MSDSALPASSMSPSDASERSRKDVDDEKDVPVMDSLGEIGGAPQDENAVGPHVIVPALSPCDIRIEENKHDLPVERPKVDTDVVLGDESQSNAPESNLSLENLTITSVLPSTPESIPPAQHPTPNPSISIRRTLAMPTLSDLSDLMLHSPSAQIVGTPFATDTTRFEYPFPEGAASTPPSPSPPIIGGMSFSPSLIAGPSTSSHSLSTFPIPASIVSYPSTSYPSSSTLHNSSSFASIPPEISVSYKPTHPKLKASANPPIPPSLAKKRPRWSLNLLGRRKSSSGSHSSTASEQSGTSGTPSAMESILAGRQQVPSPLGSPNEKFKQ